MTPHDPLLEGPCRGRWSGESPSAPPSWVISFSAGNLVTVTEEGLKKFGAPSSFTSSEGLTGEALMRALLRQPLAEVLYHGALRSSIGALIVVARFGFEETRRWDGPGSYILDTNEGIYGCVDFSAVGCVGVVSCDDPWRPYNVEDAVECVPESLREVAVGLTRLPMFSACDLTSLFWAQPGQRLGGAEPWHTLFSYGGELFRRELYPDEVWMEDVVDDAELTLQEATLVVEITRQVMNGELPNEGRLLELLPSDATHRAEALGEVSHLLRVLQADLSLAPEPANEDNQSETM